MTTIRRTKILGVHVSFFRYGPHQWSFTIYGKEQTQELIVRRYPYWKCRRLAKLNIELYHL